MIAAKPISNSVVRVLFLGLLIAFSVLWYNWAELNIRLSLAKEQVSIFEAMRTQALNSTNAINIRGCIEYIRHYYPSGTKQVQGSDLDVIVEKCRVEYLRETEGYLTQILKQDIK